MRLKYSDENIGMMINLDAPVEYEDQTLYPEVLLEDINEELARLGVRIRSLENQLHMATYREDMGR